jgi:putative DNA primase/helicase
VSPRLASPTTNGWARFRGDFRCPACGGSEDDPRGNGSRCYGAIGESSFFCTRESHSQGCRYNAGSNAYQHRRYGKCPCGEEHGRAVGRQTGTRAPQLVLDTLYEYRDEAGAFRLGVARFRDPKTFRQFVLDPAGKRVWSVKGVRPIPFKLPELVAAPLDQTVYVVEGEKDVLNLMAVGLVATCNPMGAGKWRDEYGRWFKGRNVIIIRDNDEAGRAHGDQVARLLDGIAASIKILDLPGLAPKGDVSDWLAAGGTAQQLQDLAAGVEGWKRPTDPEPSEDGNAPSGTDLDRELSRLAQTDVGAAERLIRRHGEDLRFCHPWNKWLTWDGLRWALDQTAAVSRSAMHTAHMIRVEAEFKTDEKERRTHRQWGKVTEHRSRIEAMMHLAKALEGVPVLPSHLDQDPWLLNVLNGTLDLKTGELRPHRREDLITALAPVEYHADATCPLWESTLGRIFDGNERLIQFFQRLCGRCLTGDVSEQVLPILYGTGANGKSTILNVLLGLLGPDYAMEAPPGLLLLKSGESHPTDRASLFGKRLVVDVESAEGARLNENLVKQLTGGDMITARRMREDFWSFTPTHKLMLATNHEPEIRETKNAIWRRLKLIPFTVAIPEEEQIADLPQRLQAEYSGILAWCVRGLADWQFNGLQPPDEVVDATAAYRAEQDTLAEFLAEECMIDRELKAKAGLLYERYRGFLGGLGLSPISSTAFGKAMIERGFERHKSGGNWYLGLGLRSSEGQGKCF